MPAPGGHPVFVPTLAGIQTQKTFLDSRLRGNDNLGMQKLPDPLITLNQLIA